MVRAAKTTALISATLIGFGFTASWAEDVGNTDQHQSGYIITLGGFADVEPKFEGSRRYRVGFLPLFDVREANAKEWLNLPRDAVDFALFETESLRAGVVGNGRWGRDTNSLVRGYHHVGDINLSLEAGGFAEWWPYRFLRSRVEVREALVGANGAVCDLSADIVTHPLDALTWTAGPRLSLADANFMKSYYSVNAQQATRSGLPEYAAAAGTRSVGVGSMLRYKWNDGLSNIAFIEYQRIADSAFDSPLISRRGSPNQTTVGIGTSVSFSVGN